MDVNGHKENANPACRIELFRTKMNRLSVYRYLARYVKKASNVGTGSQNLYQTLFTDLFKPDSRSHIFAKSDINRESGLNPALPHQIRTINKPDVSVTRIYINYAEQFRLRRDWDQQVPFIISATAPQSLCNCTIKALVTYKAHSLKEGLLNLNVDFYNATISI